MAIELINPDHKFTVSVVSDVMGISENAVVESFIELGHMLSVFCNEPATSPEKLREMIEQDPRAKQLTDIIYKCWKAG